jgi:hypothetical protein
MTNATCKAKAIAMNKSTAGPKERLLMRAVLAFMNRAPMQIKYAMAMPERRSRIALISGHLQ